MNVIFLRRQFVFLFLGALATLQLAQAADDSAIIAPIAKLNEALLTIMKAGRATPFTQRMKMLAPAIEQAFDLPGILRTSVGLRWNEFSDDQKNELLRIFELFTLASYTANFDSFDGQRFEILPEIRQVGDERIVQTRIVPKNGDASKLDYVMRQEGGVWKAVDVLLDGSISRVAIQRSDFRTTLASGGAPALIRTLHKKVADLSDGAIS
ncbi:MAG: ABC transporter substrate-binding protein [Acidobacteriia bacterium]|nr:ABC transporter substrate-binding protein [Methyloceanibacter sp.]MBX5472211.1 ABC transporter substrate-binding protein [Acetobacteraceae bacterium]MCL6491026.1 ABC transporter substrate-binding protein [Terriglobia bacterium]